MNNIDLNQFFAGMDTTESYAILVAFFLCFLLGLLIGLLLRGRRISKYKKQNKELRKKLDETNTLLTNSTQELTASNQKIEQLKAENYQLTEKLNILETEKNNALNEVLQLNASVEQLESQSNNYASSSDELANLQADNDQHLQTISSLNATIEKLNLEIQSLHNNNSSLNASLAESQTKIAAASASNNNAIDSRFAALENRIADLVSDNRQLRNDLANFKTSTSFDSSATTTNEPTADDLLQKEKAVLSSAIPGRAIKADDLTKIDGIGEFLAQKLNDEGIFNYAQIAKLNANDIAILTDKIGYLPGRIEKDNWVGQAQAFVAQQLKDLTVGTSNNSADNRDLKIIEGIGPKIEQLLKAAGITTWEKLALTTKEEIESILHAAGNRYKMHDPSTWSKQAAMAADGRWDELNKWQDELKGGRE